MVAGGKRLGLRVVDQLVILYDVGMRGELSREDDRADHGEQARDHEREGVAVEEHGPQTAQGRPDDEAADLEGRVEAEGLASLVVLGAVDDRAARGRVVELAAAPATAQHEEGERGDEERQH